MSFRSEALQILARQMGQDNVFSRAELETKLASLLRLVLRTGQGHPSLLQWVRLMLPEVAPAWPFGGQINLEGTAQHLARLLCGQLLWNVRAQRGTLAACHTVLAC
jgi:hypothetical protein